MNILDLISKETGIAYRKKASTHGGEFSGSCPWCSGEDRFSIHPSKNHYVCRQCKKAGDDIEFIKVYLSKSYLEACQHIGITPQYKFKQLSSDDFDADKWDPREIKFPSSIWQKKAAAFLFEKFKFLLSPHGKKYREYLNKRGISNETIKKARIGYNSSSVSFSADSWGIVSTDLQKLSQQSVSESDNIQKNDKPKNVWIPEGFIIPQFYNQKLIRLRIRQKNPLSLNRFIVVLGSAGGYFNYNAHLNPAEIKIVTNKKPWIVVEAELDGWALKQIAGATCQIFAIGNSTSRPDINTHNIIKNLPGLVCLDNDEAGINELKWWKKQYPQSIPWLSKYKDPGEDFAHSIDLKKWLQKGLGNLHVDQVEPKKQTFKEKVLAKHDKPEPVKKLARGKKEVHTPKTCLHNLYCMSLKKGVCLVDKKKPLETLNCPKGFWSAFTEGVITEIILGPGMKR